MAQQLIFTSAPAGLRSGTRGYTTVAATRGITPPAMTRLEGLSGYRLAFNLSDDRAQQNPVAFSHQLLRQGGAMVSMLSRIAACGVDYTGRSNFLAHHVLLDPAERPAAGPAWLLAQPGFMRQSWEETPTYLDDALRIPGGSVAPARCAAWERVAGDAGWAGVLLAEFRDSPRKPVYLVYPSGTDVLALFAEAIALLPPARRWQATFSTYFSATAADLVCNWRGVLAASPSAASIEKVRGATIIDLTRPLGPPPPGPLVDAARAGVSVESLFTVHTSRPEAAEGSESEIGIVADDEDDKFFDESKDYDLSVFGVEGNKSKRIESPSAAPSHMAIAPAPPMRRRGRKMRLGLPVAVALVITIGVVAIIWISNARRLSAAEQLAHQMQQHVDAGEPGRALELFTKASGESLSGYAIVTKIAVEAEHAVKASEVFNSRFADVSAQRKSLDQTGSNITIDTLIANTKELDAIALTDKQKGLVRILREEIDERHDTETRIARAEVTRIAAEMRILEDGNEPREAKAAKLPHLRQQIDAIGNNRWLFKEDRITIAGPLEEPFASLAASTGSDGDTDVAKREVNPTKPLDSQVSDGEGSRSSPPRAVNW